MQSKIYGIRYKGIGRRKGAFSCNPLCLLVSIPVFLYTFIPLLAQQKAVQYAGGFEFKEGIYLSIRDFRNNAPIPPSKIVFSSNKNDKDFLKYVLDKTTFTYIDSSGKEQQIKTDAAWGYSSNETVYINHGTDFNRVTVIGSVCHFVATIPMKTGVSDPFYNNRNFGDPDHFTYVSEQLIIDLESGKVLTFNVENMEALLSRDEVLYKEFTSLKKKQKRNSIFLYLRKYNEKHPVYFPE
ncbi:MAG: hypothetical protein EPN85_14015 [Bacteroidetes bacterium]|nr:MAG: hypothetical protein EPN85_14015 [Bacteroidota bacterium]